ncbi:MAG: PKD domain-containing protein [Bacteroidetes bacterium]|nr:PKD domain-containing protein [Bacteroidota bacterium]
MKTKSILVATATITLLSFSNCMKKPMACVDSATKTGTVGQAVSFDASCSMNAAHYEWDFGDGATSSGSSASTTHAYNSAGTYTAKLKAMTKKMKKQDEKTITVTVN